MNEQNQTAGKTAKTKPVWGIVALIGLLAATTVEGSLIITAIATAMFGLGAYLGGYFEPLTKEGGTL